MNVIEFIEIASTYSPETIEGKRRQLIIFCLSAALKVGDIKLDDDIEAAVEKASKTLVQLKYLWIALKREKPIGVV